MPKGELRWSLILAGGSSGCSRKNLSVGAREKSKGHTLNENVSYWQAIVAETKRLPLKSKKTSVRKIKLLAKRII